MVYIIFICYITYIFNNYKYILYEKMSSKIEKLNIVEIILLFIPVWILYYVRNFNGFSLGKYFILYLLGYYILSNDIILEKLINKNKVNFVHLAYNFLYYTLFYKDVVFKFPPIFSRLPFSLMVVVPYQYPSLFLGLD